MITKNASPLSWSRSQISALKECRRKFFFLSSAADKSKSDPFHSQVVQLKKIKNRFLWSGAILHETIGDILKTVRQGAPVAHDEIISKAREKMRSQYQMSKSASAGSERLFEHVYGISLPNEAWQRSWQSVENGVSRFLQSKWLSRLSSLGPECWKAVDEVLEFNVGEIKAFAKIDCAVETGGRFFLIDWKSSTPSKTSEESLLISALYAHEVWGAEANQIEAMAVSVMDGAAFHAQVDEDSLMQTYLRIEEEAQMLEEARISSGNNFSDVTPAAHLDVCRSCSYQKICHPSGV